MIGHFKIPFNRPCLVGNELEYIADGEFQLYNGILLV